MSTSRPAVRCTGAVLRREVRSRLAWVSWRAAGRGLFEIEGVPEGVLREFSRRRVEIERRALQLTGVAASMLSRDRLQGIALATRRAKEYGVDGARWQQQARARAAEHGLGQRELQRLATRLSPAGNAAEADIVRGAAERLSGAEGLTAQHNTFSHRHALAEIAAAFVQGAGLQQLLRATRGYLEQRSVVGLGVIDGEQRFTTRDLLACERAIIDSACHSADARIAVVDCETWARFLHDIDGALSAEQAAAARALLADGRGVSVVQALAGTGKTRMLASVARVYEACGYRVVGVAPTGRAARELAQAAGIQACTIQRFLLEAEEQQGISARTVVLVDEAGTAPTRPSAQLFALARRAGAKVIAVGDRGQLPSVAAGGWFSAIAAEHPGSRLRQVMRQRDPAEREALALLHAGEPDRYLQFKRSQGTLAVHEREAEALAATLAAWDQARRRHGLAGAVMIARDNTTRAILNSAAAQLLSSDASLGKGLSVGEQMFRIGERVIARRNDRHRDLDNGMLGEIVEVDLRSAQLTLRTDEGARRIIDSSYACEHLEPAYALTGHGAHGGTFEWVAVVGRACEFSREWSYTALSRARGQTVVHLIAQTSTRQRQREQYAPPEPERTREQALEIMLCAMRRREAEELAVQQAEMPALPPPAADGKPAAALGPSPGPGAEPAAGICAGPPANRNTISKEPDWRAMRQARGGRASQRGLER